MCIEHADSIKTPLKRPAAAPPSQVWCLHTSTGPQTSEVAARPLQCQPALMASPFTHPDQHHLWSRRGFNLSERTQHLKLSQSLEIRRRGSCLQFMGICASGIWIISRCITKGLCRWTAWWTQVGGSNSHCTAFVAQWGKQILCVMYAQTQKQFSLHPSHLNN